jgi:hypothetical protein
LLGFVKYATPHLLGGTISNLNFAFFNLVLDKEVPSLNLLDSLGWQECTIQSQVNRGQVIFKYDVLLGGISLGLYEIECPKNGGQRVINRY